MLSLDKADTESRSSSMFSGFEVARPDTNSRIYLRVVVHSPFSLPMKHQHSIFPTRSLFESTYPGMNAVTSVGEDPTGRGTPIIISARCLTHVSRHLTISRQSPRCYCSCNSSKIPGSLIPWYRFHCHLES